MWHSFSFRYIKENRTASLLLAATALLASLFLSLLTSLAYNIWMDYKKQVAIKGITQRTPSVLYMVYGIILVLLCIALIAMIHNAFAVSMESRLHQLGILASVGATPKQIYTFLLQEAVVLCMFPILLGTVTGVVLCYGFVRQAIHWGQGLTIGYKVSFEYSMGVAAITLGAALLTIVFSAGIPARRLSRLSPMDAIFYGNESEPEKMRTFRLYGRLFGIYGELVRKSIYNRRKEMRVASGILFLAFISFFIFMSAETVSSLSTQKTYYEKFENVWDIMLTKEAEDTDITQDYAEETFLQKVRSIVGVSQCIRYQKVDTTLFLPDFSLSEELKKAGIENLLPDAKREKNEKQEGWQMDVHLLILDAQSFANYCREQSIFTDAEAIMINLLWDDTRSSYRNRQYIPFVKDSTGALYLEEKETLVPTFTYCCHTTAMPAIREELEQKALNLVVSEETYASVKKRLQKKSGEGNGEVYYNICLSEEIRNDPVKSEKIQEELTSFVSDHTGEWEGRLKEEASDQAARKGFHIVISTMAIILACIGISGILSTTLGQLYQRKKEFARYLSVGVSPKEIEKLLLLEGTFIIGRPILLAFLVDIPVTALFLYLSPPTVGEFLRHIPVIPLSVFLTVSVMLVAAVYLAAIKNIRKEDLATFLKDETML